MGNLRENIYNKSPHFIQNLIVSLYNILAYRKRYSGKYNEFIKHYYKNKDLTLDELKKIQTTKYRDFINYAIENSEYYNKTLNQIESPESIDNIRELPIIDKETLRNNIQDVYTIPKNTGIISKTGGTTGKSLEVVYTEDDVKERFAILDTFRNNFGYKLGKKTAWFSGKNLLNSKNINKNRFWKTDYIYNVRYYSTFHIHSKYLKYYLGNLIKYKPLYMVGFPSTMYEVAKYGLANNIDFPINTIKAIFPTAETITDEIREVLENYFKTNLYNQYASSEGAPFIIECINKNLHLELQSGVFEVLDENNTPSNKGRLVATAFNTHGTPLIRYDIGDQIELKEGTCNCGNNNPLVKEVLGRISDFIYSEEMGKINLGNVSNCLKGVKGIVKFQIQQDSIQHLLILIEKDENEYTSKYENIFLQNLRERVGEIIQIKIEYIEEIPVEKSGKFRLIKNNIKNKILI
ncbi:phenylacetate--CoA ligase family protein [Flavivirga rizhaonensis]|uniref:Phenylacetate--CoA ligase family protein n=1 Tax=Flavivirga rizhaonensis TaxID=2559571 RepID=A0A4S1E073_9FLAO|nr:phenylacetate--CoA ligase family protein [Flavivirga rizhaonensis]TGV03946.1 phenylacetate--CoA ligase family protein [Flavivirga rizhaonensis]